jgi:hypothetical protein
MDATPLRVVEASGQFPVCVGAVPGGLSQSGKKGVKSDM